MFFLINLDTLRDDLVAMSLSPPTPSRPRFLKIAGIVLVLTLILVGAVAAIGYYVMIPRVVERTIEQRVKTLKERADLDVEVGRIEPDGFSGIILHDVVLRPPDVPQALMRVDTMHVGIDEARLLAGDRIIDSILIEGATLTLRRGADGTFDVATIVDKLRSHTGGDEEREERADPEGRPGFLRHFGGTWPDITLRDATLVIEDETGQIPLRRAHTDAFVMEGDKDVASCHGGVTLESAPSSLGSWSIPERIDLSARLALPLHDSEFTITPKTPLFVQGIEPFPYLRIGVHEVSLSHEGRLRVTAPSFAFQDDPEQTPLFRADSMEIGIENLLKRRPDVLSLTSPKIVIRRNEEGATNLGVLRALVASPLPDSIQERAMSIADAIASAPSDEAQEEDEMPSEKDSTSSPRRRDSFAGLLSRVEEILTGSEHLSVTLHDAEVHLFDAAAAKEGDAQMSHIAVTGAHAELVRHKEKFVATLAFALSSGEGLTRARGDIDLRASVTPSLKAMKAKGEVRSLDLGALTRIARLLSIERAQALESGTLRATFEVERPSGASTTTFSADLSIEKGRAVWPRLSEEVIDDWTVGYAFEGYFDPQATIPAAKLLTTALDANVPEPGEEGNASRYILQAPPTKGALVFEKGKARLGAIHADVRAAFYGIDRDKPLPARLDFDITLEKMQVQRALDSIPDALLGDLAQAKLDGQVSMQFKLEAPLYDASEMKWEGEPLFEALYIQHLPQSVDVRRMTQAMHHTIKDDSVLYSRDVTLPVMRSVPSRWLMDQTGLGPDDIEAHWERGGFGHLTYAPAPSKPWLSNPEGRGVIRAWQPWRRGESSPMASAPYGPYVYTPLHHISPWLIRASMTTEDNSFFTHDGFNRYAIKHSIERNLVAGDYVRGASTISMQLIKNLFLTRKKVMARKLQETILVYLMENVVKVPKARMLEIYFNIIEFGPGVFGIHDAAVHYFGKRPDQLTLAECAWLVTIVPSPKRWHFYYNQGEMSDRYFDKITRYLEIMHKRERITQEELDLASQTKPLFHVPEIGEPALRPSVREPERPALELLFPGLFGPSSDHDTTTATTPRPIPSPAPTPPPSPAREGL